MYMLKAFQIFMDNFASGGHPVLNPERLNTVRPVLEIPLTPEKRKNGFG